MSDDPEVPRYAARPLTPGVAEQPVGSLPLAPRVPWGSASKLHIGAGALAGIVVPFALFRTWSITAPGTLMSVLFFLLISGALVGLVGGGIPLLSAWVLWLIVSRPRRGLRREVVAVLIGAIAGGAVVSVPTVTIFAGGSSPILAAAVLVLGGIPGFAFALWVAGAWRRARQEALT